MMNSNMGPAILLSSGHRWTIRGVVLFENACVDELEALKGQAAKLLGSNGGISLGLFGSPGMELVGGMAALAAIRSVANFSRDKKLNDLLREVHHVGEKVQKSGLVFEWHSIENIQFPDPSRWSATSGARSGEIDLTRFLNKEIPALLEQHRKTNDDIDWKRKVLPIEVPVGYRFLGEEFIEVIADEGHAHLRWRDVCSYIPPRSNTK